MQEIARSAETTAEALAATEAIGVINVLAREVAPLCHLM